MMVICRVWKRQTERKRERIAMMNDLCIAEYCIYIIINLLWFPCGTYVSSVVARHKLHTSKVKVSDRLPQIMLNTLNNTTFADKVDSY